MFEIGKLYKFIGKANWFLVSDLKGTNICAINYNDVIFIVKDIEIDIGYKSTHVNHPCTLWVRDSKENFNWTIQHGIALCDEYSFRYGKTHASKKVIQDIDSLKKSLTFGWESLTMFAQAVPVEYKNSNDAVAAYRKYYLEEKSDIAHWNKNRKAPEWWTKCVK